MRDVPPLNPLHVFVVASRLGSFTKAAEQLGVTQSAVSRQVSVLEDFLGLQLFVRDRQGIAPTPVGQRFWNEVAPAFEAIGQATARLRRDGGGEPLRLRVYATFAVKWLLARLPGFQAAFPDIDVRLSTAVAPVDFRRDEVDLAIQFGAGDWPGLRVRRLMADVIQPVCSPKLLAGGPPLAALDDLGRHRLLHSHYRRHDWRDWLSGAGRLDLLQEGMEFTSSVLTLQAATDGLGVAIGQMALLGKDLREGNLVALFDRALERPMGHYVVWPAERSLRPKERAFVSWLREETT